MANESDRIGVVSTINNHPRLNLKTSTLYTWRRKYWQAKLENGYSKYTVYIYIYSIFFMDEERKRNHNN